MFKQRFRFKLLWMKLNSSLKVTLYLEAVARRCSLKKVFLKTPVPE